MKLFIRMRVFVGILGVFFFLGTSGLYAGESKLLPKGMTPEKLETSVVRTLNYMDKRLLSGKSAKKIEVSKNREAIARLKDSREERKKIGVWVKQGQFEEAYWALKGLNLVLREAIVMSRAKERAAKKAKDSIDSARGISNAFYSRAKQRGIHKGNAGKQALGLLVAAVEKRTKAQALEADKDYDAASTVFQKSTKMLKKAIAIDRKLNRNNSVAKL
jgi:hypothetical protein